MARSKAEWRDILASFDDRIEEYKSQPTLTEMEQARLHGLEKMRAKIAAKIKKEK